MRDLVAIFNESMYGGYDLREPDAAESIWISDYDEAYADDYASLSGEIESAGILVPLDDELSDELLDC